MELSKNPIPLEEVDPELGELLSAFCNGELIDVPVVGRNDPCPCLSGKKFKKCTCLEFHPK